MIVASIFDMDGLLIDSEPIWKQCEIEIFNNYGVPLTYEMTHQTMGLRTDEVVAHWYKRYPWKTATKIHVGNEIDDLVLKTIQISGKPLPGAIEAIHTCKSAGMKIAVASSSSLAIITAVLDRFGVSELMDAVHSAHDEPYGKPHPAVFLRTAETLQVHTNDCVVFEDSPNGVIAAKAAKMHCIAVPDPSNINDKRFGIADAILPSLQDFTVQMLGGLH